MDLVKLMRPSGPETQIERWTRLRTLADSGWHLPDKSKKGSCYGSPGCPTCEATKKLEADVGKMLDLIEQLSETGKSS